MPGRAGPSVKRQLLRCALPLLSTSREGDLLLHDNDVDLAVLNPNWPQLLQGLRAALPPKYTVKGGRAAAAASERNQAAMPARG